MEQGTSLDDILNDAPEPVAETPEAPEPEIIEQAEPEAPAEGPVRDEKGRFAPKGENEGSSPEPKSEPALDHPALLGERRRRQEAEDRLKALEEQLRATPAVQPWQQQTQPQANEFNEDLYWSNPQQFLSQFADNLRRQMMDEVQGIIPQVVSNVSIERAEAAARARHQDYDEAFAAFRDAAAVNPDLRAKLGVEADPAEFAYNEGKRLLAIASAGSLEAYIEAEVAKRTQAQAPAPQPTIPETLATAPASRAPAGLPIAPPSLDQILSGR